MLSVAMCTAPFWMATLIGTISALLMVLSCGSVLLDQIWMSGYPVSAQGGLFSLCQTWVFSLVRSGMYSPDPMPGAPLAILPVGTLPSVYLGKVSRVISEGWWRW